MRAQETDPIASQSSDGDVLDEARYRSICDLPITDKGGKSIVQLFLYDAEMRIDELKRLLALIDTEGIARCAHGLRGSAGNIGALQVMHVSTEIDSIARQNNVDPIGPLLAQLESEFDRVKRAMVG